MHELSLPVVALLVELSFLAIAWLSLSARARRRGGHERSPAAPAPGRSPAALRYLLRRRFGRLGQRRSSPATRVALDVGLFGWREDDGEALGATILNLAAQGNLSIEENAAGTFGLQRLEGGSEDLPPEERAALTALFAEGGRHVSLAPGTADVIRAKRDLEVELVRSVGGPIFSLHRRWAVTGYGLALLVVLGAIAREATVGLCALGLGTVLFVPAAMAVLARALRTARPRASESREPRSAGAPSEIARPEGAREKRRRGPLLPRLALFMALAAGGLVVARALGMGILLDSSRWTVQVKIGPLLLLALLIMAFSLASSIIPAGRTKTALALEGSIFVLATAALIVGWCDRGGTLAAGLSLVGTGSFIFLIGRLVLRAPTAMDDDLVTEAGEVRAALADEATAAAGQSFGHPFRGLPPVDRGLSYAVALEVEPPPRAPSWFQDDWEARGGSGGFVRRFTGALARAAGKVRR